MLNPSPACLPAAAATLLRRRSAGVLLHPSSLPGPHGSGDLGADAHRFVDWLAEAGQTLWQTLPLNPAGPGDSPYMSPSAFGGHAALVALAPLVDAGWLPAASIATPPAFAGPGCDFERAGPWRLARLREAAVGFFALARPAEHAAFDAWCAAESGWLDDEALFMALDAAFAHQPWWTWPAPLKWRGPVALAAAREEHAGAIAAWRFVQWCFHTQLAALRAHAHARGIALVGDLPIFIAHHSVDCWARPDLYELDADGQPTVVAGVPPDDLGPEGQRWGNPLYRWARMADEGYAWWTARLRRTLAMVDAVRIDHFLGFVHHWEIAADAPGAKAGRWVPGPGQALFDAMSAALGPLPVIAEDLGLVTPAVHALRRACGLPGMKIAQFAFGSDGTHEFLPHNCPPDSVIYTGTHDNDTAAGWWQHAPARERAFAAHALRCDAAGFVRALVQGACQSPAAWAIFPMQDVLGLGSAHRMNQPGTLGGSNWRWRFGWDQLGPELAPWLAGCAAGSGRAAIEHLRLPPRTPAHGATGGVA